jgi:cysteine desulfurase/selenocysteine lyase
MATVTTARPTHAIDWAAVREDFPILKRLVHGKRLVYLDSAATSQKPAVVIEALREFYRTYNANIHRGVYLLSEEATAAYEEARRKVARFINARSPREVVFTRNTTEAINLVAYSWGRHTLKPGDRIVLTIMEHHSNLVPWQLLAEETGARLEFVGITPEGLLDLDQLDRALEHPVKLVAVVHTANALGTINPVREIARRAHAVGALCLVDGAQSVPHMPVDVQAIGCDFLAFSGHKMLGPTGIGVLWGRLELLESMPPFIAGGGMIRRVTLAKTTFADVPERFEGGTPAIAQAIGLGVAVDYLSSLGMEAVRQHEQELTAYALERLATVEGLRIFGPLDAAQRGGVLSFYLADIHPHDVASILDQQGIAVRAGHHCCQPLMDFLGVPATARASFYVYNSREDVDALVEGLHIAKQVFGHA